MNDERRIINTKMMISISREKGFQAKQEGDNNNEISKLIPKAASTSRQWSGLRNPRIVRVSRSFGGKDRHSKVCTIRGLRDRRIRLSVPTAIQLYDLQDRLGLSQPSKVIDWLLDVTKNDIDKLPPLQMPQGFGTHHHQFHQQMLLSHLDQSNSTSTTTTTTTSSQPSLSPFFDVLKDGGFQGMFKINENVNGDVDALSRRSKGKEVESENVSSQTGKWIKTNDHQKNQDHHHGSSDYNNTGAQNFFPGLLNSAMPFNSYYHWEPSNLSLSQYGSHDFLSQNENSLNNTNNNSNALPLQSSLAAFPSGGSQLFFCPQPATVSSLFPSYSPYVSTPAESHDSRQMNNNHFQLLSSTTSQHHNNILPNSLTINSSPAKPFLFNVNHPAGLPHTHTDSESHPNKDNN